MKEHSWLVEKIKSDLLVSADADRKEKARTYYPTSMEVIGVPVPGVRNILKQIQPDLKAISLEGVIQLCHILIDTKIFECQQIAYEIIGKNRKLIQKLSPKDIRMLDKNQDNWVSVDTFSGLILGVCWRLGKVTDQEIFDRARSDNFWIRRQALVATLGWNQKARGGTGNTEKTIQLCELFIDDHHDMINKALSWALRELSKTDKKAVVSFMEKHEKRLAGRVKREVWNKIRTGLKNS